MKGLVIENDLFAKTFWYHTGKPGSIKMSVYLKSEKAEIVAEEGIPLFEFVINNQLVTANDPLWVFEKHSIREMGNGGTEHTLVFRGVESVVDGL